MAAAASHDVVTAMPPALVEDQLPNEPTAPSPSQPPRVSLVERFLEVRGLERKRAGSTEPSKVGVGTRGGLSTTPTATMLARIPQRQLWDSYSKRRHSDRTAFARQAMRVPDDSYSESTDVYNPKKRAMALIKVHEDADDTSRQFLYRARRLCFEREVVDRVVCDLIENQAEYDDALDLVYAASDEDEEDNRAVRDDSDGGSGSHGLDPAVLASGENPVDASITTSSTQC